VIYCFDLDNTLFETSGMDYKNSVPIRSRIKIVNQLFDSGAKIIIDPARGSGRHNSQRMIRKLEELTVRQLKEAGCRYHILRVAKKFPAECYVDDKAMDAETFFEEFINHSNQLEEEQG